MYIYSRKQVLSNAPSKKGAKNEEVSHKRKDTRSTAKSTSATTAASSGFQPQSSSQPVTAHHRSDAAAAIEARAAVARLLRSGSGYVAPSAAEILMAADGGGGGSTRGENSPSEQHASFAIWDTVEVRDFGEAEWGAGVVEGFESLNDEHQNHGDGNHKRGVLVLREGFKCAYVWDECRRMPPSLQPPAPPVEKSGDAIPGLGISSRVEEKEAASSVGVLQSQEVFAEATTPGKEVGVNSPNSSIDTTGSAIEWGLIEGDKVGTVAYRRQDRPSPSPNKRGGGGTDNKREGEPISDEDEDEAEGVQGGEREKKGAILGVLGRFDHSSFQAMTALGRLSGRVAGVMAMAVACAAAAFLFLANGSSATECGEVNLDGNGLTDGHLSERHTREHGGRYRRSLLLSAGETSGDAAAAGVGGDSFSTGGESGTEGKEVGGSLLNL